MELKHKRVLNNPKIQDNAIGEYKKRQWNYMKDVQKYAGKSIGELILQNLGC